MEIVKENQKKVLFYIEKYKSSPLNFGKFRPKGWELYNLPDLIIKILQANMKHSSVDQSGEWETGSGCARSSLDIWRHVVYFRPKVKLINVMSELYRLSEKKRVSSWYCGWIERRVFVYSKKSEFPGVDMRTHRDEYGLTFYDWEDIDKEK